MLLQVVAYTGDHHDGGYEPLVTSCGEPDSLLVALHQ
jgi:hypothetical protein